MSAAATGEATASEYTPGPLDRDAPFYVAGHRGLVGSAIWRRLEASGFSDLIGRSSSELDLKDRDAVFAFFEETKPKTVVLAAAKVGGILANSTYPVDFLSDNLRIQVNVLDAALAQNVERVLFLGSSCIYPKLAPQPIKEEYLLTGHLEPTNDAYAIAKIAGILQIQSVRKQYGLPWISAMPTNLYGPGDNFSPQGSHVLPALIRRYDEARRDGVGIVSNWGSGSPRREFLHVDDMADASLFVLDAAETTYQQNTRPMLSHINVGSGEDLSVADLAMKIAKVTGFSGQIKYDHSRPDGAPRKLLDVSKLAAMGWRPSIGLDDGIRLTYQWFLENVAPRH